MTQSPAVPPDVADLGHDLDGDQGRARRGAAGLLRRGPLHPGVGGAAGRGAWLRLALLPGGSAARVVLSGVLVNVGTYGLLYWGMQFVASGVAGVVNMSTISVFLFGFAILFGQERARWRHLERWSSGSRAWRSCSPARQASNGATSKCGPRPRSSALALLLARLGAFASAARPGTPLQLTAAQGVVAAMGMSAAVACAGAGVRGNLCRPDDAAAARRPPVHGLRRHLRRLHHLPAAGARLGRTARRPVCVRVAGGGADGRRLVLGERLTWREIAGGAIMLVAAAIAVAPRSRSR